MTGRTNYTPVTNASTMDGPAQITDVYEHFDPLVGESRANAAALPASGNWYNRTIMAEDTKAIYVWNGTAWVMLSQPWTTFTPSATNLVLGTGGSTPYAEYRITNGSCEVQVGWILGSSGFTVGDINLTPPVAIRSSRGTYAIPIGSASYIDTSAGASGRYWAPLYATGGNIRHVSLASAAGLMAAGLSTAPFTWAASDEIHMTATFPV